MLFRSGEKKLKKKGKEGKKKEEEEEEEEKGGPPAPAGAVSVEDVRRKLGASSLEKKKEKALKGKRSVKETLLGRKGL